MTPPTTWGTVYIFDDAAAAMAAAARAIADAVAQADVTSGQPPTLLLAGGTTPLPVYAALRLDRPVEVFLTDERVVPANDPQNNGRAIAEALGRHHTIATDGLAHAPAILLRAVVDQGVTTLTPAWLATQATQQFEASRHADGTQRVSHACVALLGLGTDGHTASLFPGDPSWTPTAAGPAYIPTRNGTRISLAAHVLRATPGVFLVTGEAKADVMAGIWAGTPCPATQVASTSTRWLIDRAAAAQLPADSANAFLRTVAVR